MKKYQGIIPAVITPLTEDGEVHEGAFRRLLDYLLDKGVHGFYVGGSTGEGLVLDTNKRKRAAEIVKDHVQGDRLVIVHVGAKNTDDTIDLAQHAESTEVDAIAAVPPFYYKVCLKAVYEYYAKITAAVKMPMFLYNIPSTTGVIIDSEKAEKLAAIENIIGIKYSHDDIQDMAKMKTLKNGNFKVFFGQDGILTAGLVMGADGGIGGSYNIMAGRYVDIFEALCSNDWKTAFRIQHEIIKYRDIYFRYDSNIAVFKSVLSHILDENMGGVTEPLRNLTLDERDDLLSELEEHGFFDFVR